MASASNARPRLVGSIASSAEAGSAAISSSGPKVSQCATIFAKATLPYFTRAEWQWKNLKILPYAKLGGTGYGMIVNAPTDANKIGAYGGGPAVGLGVEFFIWKGLFCALDFTENLIFRGSYSRTIAGVNTQVIQSGFNPQFVLNGLIGWHF